MTILTTNESFKLISNLELINENLENLNDDEVEELSLSLKALKQEVAQSSFMYKQIRKAELTLLSF